MTRKQKYDSGMGILGDPNTDGVTNQQQLGGHINPLGDPRHESQMVQRLPWAPRYGTSLGDPGHSIDKALGMKDYAASIHGMLKGEKMGAGAILTGTRDLLHGSGGVSSAGGEGL